MIIKGPANIVTLGETIDALGPDHGSGGIAQLHVNKPAFQQRRLAARGTIAGTAVDAGDTTGARKTEHIFVVRSVVGAGGGETQALGRLLEGIDALKTATALIGTPLVFQADGGLAGRLPEEGHVKGLELVIGGVLEGAIQAPDGIHAECEAVADLEIGVSLKAIGPFAPRDGPETGEILHQGPFGKGGAVATGFDLTEDQRVGTFAKVESLDVVAVRRDIPAKVIPADIVGLAEAAEGEIALLVGIFHDGRGVDIGHIAGDIVGRPQVEIHNKIGGNGVNAHRHIFQRLLRAGGRQGIVGGPAIVGRDDEGREDDRVFLLGWNGCRGV